jgi:acetate kinase
MRALAINCGSSSLKFALFDLDGPDRVERLAWGSVEDVGGESSTLLATADGEERDRAHVGDHAAAVRRVLAWLEDRDLLGNGGLVVGHRVVHGGDHFSAPVRLDTRTLHEIEAVSHLAPLHNWPALAAIKATQAALGPDAPQVATFDTAFHRTMPERASRYAIPPQLADRHGLRRYGFHGLAHASMVERAAALHGAPAEALRLVTLQLGAGCSAAAVDGGRSVDTSMGLTPLEGLMMATRSGDVDPSLPAALAQAEGLSVDEALEWLNKRSGLLGVSGSSEDMRDLLAAETRNDQRAALAVEMFCYRVRKQIGAYLAALGGADAVVFGGGIGEHQPEVRARICAGLEWCGLLLDEARNTQAVGIDARISTDASHVAAYVATVDEELAIARGTLRCLEV